MDSTQSQQSAHSANKSMIDAIIAPLDSVLQLALDLTSASHTVKRTSLQDNTFQNIILHINEAKNNIITHLFNCNQTSLSPKANSDNKNKQEKITYSSALMKKDPPPNSIVISAGTSKPSQTNVTDAEQKVISVLKKTSSNATVLATSGTENGNIVVKFKKGDDLKSIKSEFDKEFNNAVKLNSSVQPKIKIVGIPSFFDTSNNANVERCILNENPLLKATLENNKETFQFLFSFNSNIGKSLIFKCSPKVRELLKSNGDIITVEHKQCRLYDRLHLNHCGKCSKYGHSRKTCTSATPNCTYCAEQHDSLNCPNKENKNLHKCFNCNTCNINDYKINSATHNAFSDKCPIYIQLKNKLIARTDFGYQRQEQA